MPCRDRHSLWFDYQTFDEAIIPGSRRIPKRQTRLSAREGADPKRDDVDKETPEHEQHTDEQHTDPQPEGDEQPEKGAAPDTAGHGDTDDSGDGVEEPEKGTEENVDWQAKADLYRAQMRKQEQRAKTNHARNQELETELDKARSELAELKSKADDSQRSDQQRERDQQQADQAGERITELAEAIKELRTQQSALREESDRAKHQALVAEVAEEKGLTLAQASRLKGSSRQELEVDADEVVALFGLNRQPKRTAPAQSKPREKRPSRGGSSNSGGGDGRTREDIFKAVTDHRRRR